jgi:hypothetical protein
MVQIYRTMPPYILFMIYRGSGPKVSLVIKNSPPSHSEFDLPNTQNHTHMYTPAEVKKCMKMEGKYVLQLKLGQ